MAYNSCITTTKNQKQMKTRKEIEDKIKDLKKGVEILNNFIDVVKSKETIKELIKSKEDVLRDIDTLNWILN